MNVLRHDPRALDTLRTLACGIAAAVNVGAVASKWGGYFGQEWLEPGLSAALTPLPLPAATVPSKPATVGGSVELIAVAGQTPAADMTGRLFTLEAKVEQILKRLPDFITSAQINEVLSELSGGPVSKPSPPSRSAQDVVDIEEGEDEWEESEKSEAESADGSDADFDVIIVGAGAAGIGCALMLTNTFGLEPGRVLLLERGEAIGTSFRQWPEEMRFISPSFNQQGWTNSFDLNSIAYGTSPAYTLHAQHPSGGQYADYLSELAETSKQCVFTRTEVISVEPVDGVFDVHVRTGLLKNGVQKEETMRTRYVIWAAGEFQYPKEKSCCLPGMELCIHNSRVRSWAKLPGDDFVLIGGYESGADAAINLAKAGKQATVLASTASWNVQTPDPSTELAPYTAARLREVTAPGFSPRPKLLAPLRVLRVEKVAEGGFNVIAAWQAAEQLKQTQLRKPVVGAEVDGTAETGTPGAEGSELVVHTAQPPVLCTGFQGSVAATARNLFNLADASDEAKGCLAGAPMLTEDDESTKVPGVFLAGPTVRHGELSFCFIYKFRQRFGVVANAICRGLGRDTTSAVEACRKMNMYLDDFECCKGACGDTC